MTACAIGAVLCLEFSFFKIKDKDFDEYVDIEDDRILDDKSKIKIIYPQCMVTQEVNFNDKAQLCSSRDPKAYRLPEVPVDIRARLVALTKGNILDPLRYRVIEWLYYDLCTYAIHAPRLSSETDVCSGSSVKMDANEAASPAEVSPLAPTNEGSYRMLLPPLPTGPTASMILERFYGMLGERRVSLPLALSATTMYGWLLALKSAEAKEEISRKGTLTIKGKKCVVIDSNRAEKEIRVHWLPPFISDEEVTKAFASFGVVKDITREKWRKAGYEEFESTTRCVRLRLHEGVSVGDIPLQLCILSVDVLVSVPGRPPACLRCGRVGHMRRQCATPWCSRCRCFGHNAEACVPTYASMARVTGAATMGTAELGATMDELEMIEASPSRQVLAEKHQTPRQQLRIDIAETPIENPFAVLGALSTSAEKESCGVEDGRSVGKEHHKTGKPVDGGTDAGGATLLAAQVGLGTTEGSTGRTTKRAGRVGKRKDD
ncbi:hypothetical protein ISCGN_002029 [Ixodes scapularis]